MVLSPVLSQAIARVLQPIPLRRLDDGAASWTPALWFLANEQGIWLDPSDFTRYMSELGPELSQDISFDDTSKWNKGSGWSVTGGQAVHNGAAADYVNSLFTPVVGKTYKYVLDIAEIPAGSNVMVYCNGVSGPMYTAPGVYTATIFCSQAGVGAIKHSVRASNATGGTTRINSFSIKEVISASTATMFQDSAGTTPVTAVEQPVGLILDKRLGLVLGSEKVPTPYVGTGSASFTIGTDTITRSGSTGTAALGRSDADLVAGRTYLITYTVSGHSGDSWGVRCGNGTAAGPFTGNGTFSVRLVAGAAGSTSVTFLPWGGGAAAAVFSNISCKELPGNHASQATAASRPVLSARKNLLTYSEGLSNAAWTKVRVTPGTPSGGFTRITEDTSAAASHGFYAAAVAAGSGAIATYSVLVKKASTRNFGLWVGSVVSNPIDGYRKVINLATGTVTDTVVNGAGVVEVATSVTEYDATTWRIRTTMQIASGTAFGVLNVLVAGTLASNIFYTGDGVSYADVGMAQLEYGSAATTYQRVNTNTDYDTVGFPHYLKFDGVDDNLVTGNIDFTATDKMTIVAGVQKLSDAAAGAVVELSASPTSTAGAFSISAPEAAATGEYRVRLRGAAASGAVQALVAAPNTSILTMMGDLSVPSVELRRNGVSVGTNIAAMGVTSFRTDILYIGRRGGTSLPFNGYLYSLTVRGAATAAPDLVTGETFFATKTGISLP